MYTITVSDPKGKKPDMVLKTEDRSLCRSLTILAIENELTAKTVVEQKPRSVKFKGIDEPESPEAESGEEAEK